MNAEIVGTNVSPALARSQPVARTRAISRRQQLRRALLLAAALLFPVTLNFFSPYVIVDGAAQGLVVGSFLVFAAMLLSSLFLGRLWCGWLCPAGAIQDWSAGVNDKPAAGGRWNLLKWAIWVPWITLIAYAFALAGGVRGVNPLHLTENGVSVDEPVKYVTYYAVVVSFVALSFVAGRRAGCHYVCWMAPFMILGRRVRNTYGWPALRLAAEGGRCSNCGTCTRGCPMSLQVSQMVQGGALENAECILCGTCVDNCPKRAIRYSFSAGR